MSIIKTQCCKLTLSLLQESDPNMRINVQMLNQQETEYLNNKYTLESIFECILCCGKQGTRDCITGHQDDNTADCNTNRGNLIAFIKFRAKILDQLWMKKLVSGNTQNFQNSRRRRNTSWNCSKTIAQSKPSCQYSVSFLQAIF